MSDKKCNKKKRNWAFVAYPESLPADWIERLTLTGLQVAISPLHDQDLNADGEPKKPHYHIIVCYSGPTAYSVVSALTADLNATIPQPLEQVRGYYRYLTHKDNPEKVQYSESDIRTLGGFSIRDFVELTTSEVNRYKAEIQRFIRDNDIVEYADLCDILLDAGMDDQWEVATHNTYFFDKYISSRRCSARASQLRMDMEDKDN